MAYIETTTVAPLAATPVSTISARDHLARMKGVTIFDRPLPRRPEVAATVLASGRQYEVTTSAEGFSAAVHLEMGEYAPLTAAPIEDGAFAAISAHLALVAHCPAYRPEASEVDRAAALVAAAMAPAPAAALAAAA
jgi:hypothetical protein